MGRAWMLAPWLCLTAACGSGSSDVDADGRPVGFDPQDPRGVADASVHGDDGARPPGTDGGARPPQPAPATDAGEPAPEVDAGGDPPEVPDGCPAPSAAPEFRDDTTWHCPEGSRYDAAYRLCTTDTYALGPFPAQMVDDCLACGGVDCEEERWPVDQARGLRGTGTCAPGSEPSPDLGGLCGNGQQAYGPFPETWVEECEVRGGGNACQGNRWSFDFASGIADDVPAPMQPPPVPQEGRWGYILDDDYGVRSDSAGAGHFGASRSNNQGGHSGIDFLAPVGTPLYAPCDGFAVSGVAGGYGNYVAMVCAVPELQAGDDPLWASLLFAHLDTASVEQEQVTRGTAIGTVGKSGNASGASVMPHVHFEIAVHTSESDASNESHVSSDHSDNAAGAQLRESLTDACLTPQNIETLTGPAFKGRRPDPFLLLTCLGAPRSGLQSPPPALASAAEPWSDHYSASFDVDGGQ